MITTEQLEQLYKAHKDVPELNDILATRYLNSMLTEMGLEIFAEKQSDERFYFYKIETKRIELTETQRGYVIALLEHIGCSTWID